MIRRTLLTLALVAAPALAVAQQPTQAPAQQPMAAAQDTTKAKPAGKKSKKGAKGKMGKKPAAAPRDTTKKP
jgi:hypothetical protein